MIPYFIFSDFSVFGLRVEVWGIFVSLGIILSMFLISRLVREYCLSGEVVWDLMVWLILGGIIGSRLFYVFFYAPMYYVANPVEVLMFWRGGASSVGAFLGAALMGWLFMKWRGFFWREILPYFDLLALGLWFGWGVGRLGCFVIHDHPGRLSDFFLAVNFPSGARWDLGLLEALIVFILATIFFIFRKKILAKRIGLMFYGSFAVYAITRLGLDFLRATDLIYADARYLALTPAQWGSLIYLIFFAVWWWRGRKIKKIN